jgi:hypothetical protein
LKSQGWLDWKVANIVEGCIVELLIFHSSHPWLFKKKMAGNILKFPPKIMKIQGWLEWKIANIVEDCICRVTYFDSLRQAICPHFSNKTLIESIKKRCSIFIVPSKRSCWFRPKIYWKNICTVTKNEGSRNWVTGKRIFTDHWV